MADYLLPNICANHHGITVPFLSTAPRNEREKSQKSWGVAGKVQHPQYAHLQGCNSMFYKSLSCGKKVQFFATKSAIFFNPLFFYVFIFSVLWQKKVQSDCTFIALLLHFEGSQFLFLFHCVKRIFSVMLHMLHFSRYPPRLLSDLASRVRTRAHVTWGCL